MAIFTLTALSDHHEQEPGRPYKSTVIELLGNCLGRNRIEAKNVAEITTLVKTFGDGKAKRHPAISFMVSVSGSKGNVSRTASMPPIGVMVSARRVG